MATEFLGIDLAKNVFELCGMNRSGSVTLKKRVTRRTLLQPLSQLPACTIGIEACTGAFYWQRQFEAPSS